MQPGEAPPFQEIGLNVSTRAPPPESREGNFVGRRGRVGVPRSAGGPYTPLRRHPLHPSAAIQSLSIVEETGVERDSR